MVGYKAAWPVLWVVRVRVRVRVAVACSCLVRLG
jgi:hypothetical protein